MRLADGAPLAGALQTGTLGDETVVHGAALVPLTTPLPPEQACLIGCAIATGVCSVLKTAAVWEGARVGVIGCGAVGLSVIQGARIAGAAEIHALDLDERKLGRCHPLRRDAHRRRRGAAARLRLRRRRPARDGGPGAPDAGPRGHARLHRPAPAGSEAVVGLEHLFDRRLRILVSHGGDHVPDEDFPRLAKLAAEGRLDLAGMITKTIALDDVEHAFADMEAGEVIRSVVVL